MNRSRLPTTLTSGEATREPNGSLWFRAEFNADGDQGGSGPPRRPRARMRSETPAGPPARARHEVRGSPNPATRGSNGCGGEDGHRSPGRGRARASDADRAPPRRGLHQPQHPPGPLRGAPPPRRLARRPPARRDTTPSAPYLAEFHDQGGVARERRDGGGPWRASGYPRRRGRGHESEEVPGEPPRCRDRGLLFMGGMRRSEMSPLPLGRQSTTRPKAPACWSTAARRTRRAIRGTSAS